MIQTVLFNRPWPATAAAPYQVATPAFRQDVSDQWDSLTLSTAVPGGYKELNLTINEDLDEMWRWYLERLGNHIEAYDETTDTVFEGIVWDIELNWVGGNSYGISLGDLYNRVRVRYSEKDVASVDRDHAPTTPAVNDTASQANWGIKECLETEGDMEATTAVNLSNRYLLERAWPEPQPNISIPGMGSNPSLQVSALGYWATLNYRLHTDVTEAAVLASTQISSLVNGTYNPGGGELYCQFLNPSIAYINGTNLTQTRHSDNNLPVQRRMLDLIKPGDTSYNRYFIGCWNDRTLHVYPLPGHSRNGYNLTPKWKIDIGKGKLYDVMGAEWPVHRVRAGELCEVIDVPFSKNLMIAGATSFSTANSVMSLQPYYKGHGTQEIVAQIALEN